MSIIPLEATKEQLSFEHLKQLAHDIRQAARTTAEAMVDVGQKLAGVKTMYPQYFQAWCKTELQWPTHTVHQYIRIADHFGDIDWSTAQADPQALLVLTASFTTIENPVIQQARRELATGALLTRPRAESIKRECGPKRVHARPVEQAPEPRRVQAWPHSTVPDRWITVMDLKYKVMDLQRALVDAYGEPLHPAVSRALSALQEMLP